MTYLISLLGGRKGDVSGEAIKQMPKIELVAPINKQEIIVKITRHNVLSIINAIAFRRQRANVLINKAESACASEDASLPRHSSYYRLTRILVSFAEDKIWPAQTSQTAEGGKHSRVFSICQMALYAWLGKNLLM